MNLTRNLRPLGALLPLFGLLSCSGLPASEDSVASTSGQKLVSANNTITQAGDEGRTGWYPDQPGLDPTIVGGTTFGRIFQTTLPITPNEQVFAQPLVSQDGTRVLIATDTS